MNKMATKQATATLYYVLLAVACLQCSVTANVAAPQVSIGMNSAAMNSAFGGIEPKVSWATSNKIGDYDLQGGVDFQVTDKDNMPFSFWGTAKRTIKGWCLSAGVDGDSSDLNVVGIDLRADCGSTALQVTGSATNAADAVEVQVGTVKVSQKVDALGGSWTLVPRYNVVSNKGDLMVAYGFEDTVVTVDTNLNKSKVTVRRNIGDNNQVAPSISTAGDVELEYRRAVLTGTVTTKVNADTVGVSWQDGPWQANVKAPLDGGLDGLRDGAQFSFRRLVDVPTF